MCALNTTLRQQRCGLMAACVCIYLLNAALHHAGATAQGPPTAQGPATAPNVETCSAGVDGFKLPGLSNTGACSACCFNDDGSFSHCCGLRSAANGGTCGGGLQMMPPNPVICIELCTSPFGCCGPDGCSNQQHSCCPFPGEFTDPDFQESPVVP